LPWRDLTTLDRMVLAGKGRAPRIREIVTYRLDQSGGETANRIRFLDPEDIAGTRLLGIDKADGKVRAHVAAQPIAGAKIDLAGYGRLFSDQENRIVDGQVKSVSPVFAIIRSVESSGRAIIAISIILIVQFSLLGLSDFRPTAHFGMLCAVGLFAGQLFEMLLMPALLGLRLRKPRAVTAP
jgi:hypothetical protein